MTTQNQHRSLLARLRHRIFGKPLDVQEKCVKVARKHGFPADYRMDIGTDVAESATALCGQVTREFPRSTVFAGKLVFQRDNMIHRFLDHETAAAIQGRLQWMGITTVVLPIRVIE